MSATNQLPARGIELMKAIARFEYALKETGYIRANSRGAVEADWDKFANEGLPKSFFSSIRDSGIAQTLFVQPPSRQALIEGTLGWQSTKSPTDIQALIGAVRRVRNNLVHGGKSGDHDSDRNDQLVVDAITVLKEMLLVCSDLQLAFENKW